MECGIVSYGVKVPYLRLPIEETINCWKNSSVEMIRNVIGVNYRSVLSSDEDVLTLSADAVNMCINQSDNVFLS
ncbi:hypothetical protein [Bombilactobacillus bombi]|uniref:hypothetical protein n=1 Tax=Bombilactobacillus bombi TaxID=1303590 RepID=UPI0015E5EDB5|nr:hypothetical protein [Bombilactobacillus bombi]MBA1435163.1 hypothetical protein [Bombilactobacillus bombi]